MDGATRRRSRLVLVTLLSCLAVAPGIAQDEPTTLRGQAILGHPAGKAILEAAIGVFAQHGFDAATTDDIARAAGLSKGGLYWHFKSKDDILAAILMQLFDQELMEPDLRRLGLGVALRQIVGGLLALATRGGRRLSPFRRRGQSSSGSS